MKTINDYSIYCTEEQTKKALELGIPIKKLSSLEDLRNNEHCYPRIADYAYANPTAEQMISWLEEQGFYFRLDTSGCSVEIEYTCILELVNCSRKEATLAAIDAALEYILHSKTDNK